MSNYQYPCPDCFGSGETECDCCGAESCCEACDGSGIDTERIDLKAFNTNAEEKAREHGGTSWEIVENRVYVGRQGGSLGNPPAWQLFYRDFLRSPT